MQCVIPAGGKATRMHPEGDFVLPKCLMHAGDDGDGTKPILQHIVEFWREVGCNDFVVIASQADQKQVGEVMDFCDSPWRVVAPRKDTVPEALAACRPYVDASGREKFVVVLGDCLFNGEFAWGPQSPVEASIGTMAAQGCDLARSYAVQYNNQFIVTKTIEKPHMGLGCYWFTSAVWEYLAESRGITEVIERMSQQAGGRSYRGVEAIPFEGDYLNVTYPEDLARWTH